MEEDNVLIVTHEFLMMQIQKKLIDKGFSRSNLFNLNYKPAFVVIITMKAGL